MTAIPYGLTDKELQAVQAYAFGRGAKWASGSLGISRHAFQDRIRNVFRKMRVRKIEAAVLLLAQQGHMCGTKTFQYPEEPARVSRGQGRIPLNSELQPCK